MGGRGLACARDCELQIALCSRAYTIKWVEHISIAHYNHYSLDMCEMLVSLRCCCAAKRYQAIHFFCSSVWYITVQEKKKNHRDMTNEIWTHIRTCHYNHYFGQCFCSDERLSEDILLFMTLSRSPATI